MIRVDTAELKRLARDFTGAAGDIPRASVVGVNAGGELIASEARARSGWSSRIPRSIRVKRGPRGVAVTAGGAEAPHAPAYEHGGVPGTFQHPTFGHRDRMVSQAARPFLGPAEEAKNQEVDRALLAAVDVAMRKHRL